MAEVTSSYCIRWIKSQYDRNPFGVSGFAFWKIEKPIRTAQAFALESSDKERCHYATRNRKLFFYLSDGNRLCLAAGHDAQQFDLLNLHHRYLRDIGSLEESHDINEYQPLGFSANTSPKESINDNYYVYSMDPFSDGELSSIVQIINASSGGSYTEDIIRGWTHQHVFDRDLWIGAKEKRTHRSVAVGISTYNPMVKETDLDWFYVLPEHQRRGVGTMLVEGTIARCIKKSDIIRVAGMADDFYVKCGFELKDKWYYLTRKGFEIAWWDG